ncbi:hypothetical protein ABOC32_16600 [Pseudomonas sp. WOUb67]|uniref:hypothetical protein n=1 Tax=Pseudomonas sp. WOUb67 TaxID=3161136 RepID=UPI003CF946A9
MSVDINEGKKKFFNNVRTTKLMESARSKLEEQLREGARGTTVSYLLRFTLSALHEFQVRCDSFEEVCGYNIKIYNDRFDELLERYLGESNDLASLFGCCYRFVCEFDFVSESGLGSTLSNEKVNLIGIDFGDYVEASLQFQFANTQMSALVLKRILAHPDVRNFTKFEGFVSNACEKFNNFEVEYAKKIKRIGELEDQLIKSEQEYNFANLNDGFAKLRAAKIKEKILSFSGLVVMGVVLLIIPVLKISGVFPAVEDQFDKLIALVVVFGVEFLMIYFFRIFLANFRAISQQILQIDLRMTLCSFIESYSDFALEARKNDKEVLSKFEEIIFSEVSFGDSSLPSAFEGIEHISSVIGKIKGK